jgi:hypothetical protein
VTYTLLESSVAGSKPFELYLFQGVGVNYAVTSCDVAIEYEGNTYQPTTVSRDEVDMSSEVSSGQTKVYLPASHPIAALFIPYLPTSQIDITIFAGHLGDDEIFVVFSGTVASGRFTDQAELVCNSDQYKLQNKIPRILYQSVCAHIFGDSGCTKVVPTFPGVVSAISADGTEITVPAFAALSAPLVAGYFIRGNDMRAIVAQVGDVITLSAGIADLEVGDACVGKAGCQGTFTACVFYNNVDHLLAFDLIPLVNPFSDSIT